MKISSLELTNFRGLIKKTLFFNEGLNILIGKNGSGKTSILESIVILTSGRSHRTHQLQTVINKKSDESELIAHFKGQKTQKKAKVLISKYFKKMWLDEVFMKSNSDYLGFAHAVVFSSQDILSFLNSPAERRKIFDSMICSLDKEYMKDLKSYKDTIKEKNKVLKEYQSLNNIDVFLLLDVLDEKLYFLNKKIYIKREEFINSLNMFLSNLVLSEQTEKSHIKIIYDSHFKNNIAFTDFLKYRKSDTFYRTSSIGIHKDDFGIIDGNMDLCIYGSQGQIKFSLILLKLAFGLYLARKENTPPIMLFDDILGDLDTQKQLDVFKNINSDWQVIISSPSISGLKSEIINNAYIINME